MKSCAFYTLGCKVNQYETQAIREIFMDAGYTEVPFSSRADLYIINTCTVTKKTDKESRRLIRAAHRRAPRARIAVTGCYVLDNEESLLRMPGVVAAVNNRDKDRIIDILDKDAPPRPPGEEGGILGLRINGFSGRTKAFVKVQDDCNNFCSYCKIPFARGRSRSRDADSVINEIERLTGNGFREIVLTGICLGSWGRDLAPDVKIESLLSRIVAIRGDFRIRLSSIEPWYITSELIDMIASSERICDHLHIPLQSGDDRVLSLMNRPYAGQEFTELVGRVKDRIRGVSVTTDIIAGFPGETEEEFLNTERVLKEISPAKAHIFPYSKREYTRASKMGEPPPPGVIKERMNRLLETARRAALDYRRSLFSSENKMLVEGIRDPATGLLQGYLDRYVKAYVDGPDLLISRMVPVKIKGLSGDGVLAETVYGFNRLILT